MIEIKKLRVGYARNTVIDDLSLDIREGEITSLVGVNGSGKSTLLRSLAGVRRQSSGDIIIDGVDASRLTPVQRARAVSYLPQKMSAPDMTAEQMVLHGRFPHTAFPHRYTRDDLNKAHEAMERLGVEKYATTRLDELSGGTLRRVCLAMALCQDTRYILLDEPTAYLDPSSGLELMRVLRLLANDGRGIVAVMHDLPMAMSFSDRVAILSGGRITCARSPEMMLEDRVIDKTFGVVLEKNEYGVYYYKY